MKELDRHYLAVLSDPPKASSVGKVAGLAVELEGLYHLGILPEAGGWLDQDMRNVELIRLAGRARARREAINKQKTSRFKRRKKR